MVKTESTGERLMKIETTLDYMKQKQEDNDKDHKLIMEKIDAFIDSADKRYANKLVEKLVYGLVGLVLTCVFSALIYLVIIK